MTRKRLRRIATALSVAGGLGFYGCVTQKKEVKPPPVEAASIQTGAYFDVAVCGQAGVVLTSPVSADALTGYLAILEPWVQECLVDGKNRGAAPTSQVIVDAKLTDKGVQLKTSGENLTPAGAQCVQSSLEKVAKVPPLPSGAPAVKTKVTFSHNRDHQPELAIGGSNPVALATRIRLALPQWCTCFTAWQDKTPRALHADLVVHPKAPVPIAVEMELTNDSTADDISGCIKRKIEAMDVPASNTDEFKIDYPLLFIHSGVAEPLMGSPPPIQLAQLAAVARRRQAEASSRAGRRNQAAARHELVAKKVKAGRHSARTAELEAACSDLVKADEAWAAAMSQLLEIEEEAVSVSGDLKAKDAAWPKAFEKAQATVAAVQADYEKLRKLKAADETACPQ